MTIERTRTDFLGFGQLRSREFLGLSLVRKRFGRPCEALAAALAATKTILNERSRAQALASLAPHLAPEQRSEALAAALAAANATSDEASRAQCWNRSRLVSCQFNMFR